MSLVFMDNNILNKAIKAIKADYFGYPLDDELGLVETITNELSKFINDKLSISKKTSEEVKSDILEIKDKINTSTTLLKQIIKNKNYDQLNYLLLLLNDCQNLIQHNQIEAYLKNISAENLLHDIEESVRKQIRFELDRNKVLKKIINFFVWAITLILGGIIGVFFQ